MQRNDFDPNTWEIEYEHRIYGDDYANEYAIVDQIDYQFLVQWRWKFKESKSHKGTIKPKRYLARTSHEGTRESRKCSTIFLHTVVMGRTGIPKPIINKRLIVDHKDGDELNCRRNNLRYATLQFNRINRFGSHQAGFEF